MTRFEQIEADRIRAHELNGVADRLLAECAELNEGLTDLNNEMDSVLKPSFLKVDHPEDSALYVCGGYKPAEEKVGGFRL
jgi:hypothetical protein